VSEDDAFEKLISRLPVATYRAGQTILNDRSKSGHLLILKQGAVVILKDSIELARVDEPGAVFGELAALLDQPHSADVRAVEDSEIYIADAGLSIKHPVALLHVARVLARRIAEANNNLVELKKQLQSGSPPGALNQRLEKIGRLLSTGGVGSAS
jgi:CRP/FNR family transcriptional regulator, cyclic AMP receptor protein